MVALAFSMGFVLGFLTFGFIVKFPTVDQEKETDKIEKEQE